MASEDEKLATFKAIAGTDDDGFATSFLEAHDWNRQKTAEALDPSAPAVYDNETW